MITLIEYPKCSTCKKARDFLTKHEIEYQSCNIVTNTPTEKEMKQYIEKSQLPMKRFFNTSGLVYRNLNLKEKLETMSEEEQLKLLAGNGMLIKRPILVLENQVLVGFQEEKWEEALK